MNNKKKRSLPVVVLTCLLGAASAQAQVSFGPDVFVKGATIEVLRPGPDLQVIIDLITDEGPENPYLIKLGPGEYIITASGSPATGLVMAPHISIMGSGEGVTILKGAISSSGVRDSRSAIVSGADNVSLTDLSVVNTGGQILSIAVINFEASPRIERVTATATGGDANWGVLNSNSSPTMIQVTAAASGGPTNYGVSNFIGEPTMIQVTATASGDASNNYGVHNNSSSPTMSQVTATGSGGTNNYGFYHINGGFPTMRDAKVTGSGGTNNYGVYSSGNASVLKIYSSVLEGATAALRFGGNTGERIANSVIIGGFENNPGGVNCLGLYRSDVPSLSVVQC